ncbi:hypothetical protein DMN91_000428 [Ooceraea biroi]|uniref:THAP-type domain-containing protein n=1 Tax=Ooceraea biroi TaxID=2015173 RepID=A0A3L8E277_OOCBI|nr:hypothetical protein DMN91_000428 [Ooceraea biroi]
MTKPCVVPKCKTGNRNMKQQCSVFKVPRNIEQFKEWQAAIPDIELKQSHYVCEKHFEEQRVLRKWIKRDNDGRIITQVAYVRPRLANSAVPTIFDIPSEVEQGASTFQETQLQDNLVENQVDLPQESIQHKVPPPKVLPPNEIVGITSTVQNYAIDSVSTMPTVFTVCDRNFNISSTTINNETSKVATISENESITIPKSWAVTEFNEEGGQSVVFSHLVKMRRNSMLIPVLERSIKINTDKILHYYVHGRPVDPERCQLPPVLKDTSLLNTLERFKNMNICNGLGAINVHHLSRHCVLLLNEINLRKSVTVCSRNLTYVGLTDFGEDGPHCTDIQDQATHGLVLMLQSITYSYTQPIAVFASKKPVKSEELAKLLIKAIIFVEKNGAQIHGVIADGAATNVKMWSLLGVSGAMRNTKTSFTHPVDKDRKVFVFSDTPHIIKNIRNRLYNKNKLRKSSDKYICWDYFKILFDLDSIHPGNARACPKITRRHIVLDNASKMCVRLATQIFSNSVAQGLAFYLSRGVKSLAGYEETIKFCTQINDMFDALNRKSPNEGLTPETKDFKILQDSLQWLNEWESAKEKGDITADEYLTTQTSEALRMSLHSTIDLCRYLIEKFDFKYLLTGKVNQDNLEKFFGTIRQAAGSNDHPSCPTFLQLYKVLSIYSIIKPPKFGNCSISERIPSPQILLSLQELKDIYGSKSKGKSAMYQQHVQKKLDHILQHDDWEADDIIEHNNREHNNASSETLHRIIYYVTGFYFNIYFFLA